MLTKKDRNVATAEAMKLEARDRIRSLALPINPGENVKAQWRKVSRKTRFTARRVRALWYGQTASVHAHEIEVLRGLTEAYEKVTAGAASMQVTRAEIDEFRERLDQIMLMLGELKNERA